MDIFDKLILTLSASVIAAVAATAHYNHVSELTRQEAIKAGLVEGFLPGRCEKVWMKPTP